MRIKEDGDLLHGVALRFSTDPWPQHSVLRPLLFVYPSRLFFFGSDSLERCIKIIMW